ncbi:MAG: 6-pyruvoyl tetrahydropterin synthase [Thermoplasmata archaeon HGW-Thermoplasmata-1]|nr:MAG: 6-pyruvoyl tetrahydropterin synthase [Thermoplasmata archaeon HGW-Thermoplasmata-1]
MMIELKVDGWQAGVRFDSAHFIADYDRCGHLHGHTYAIHCNVLGERDEHGIVIDFTVIKRALREIADDLDHKMLIPDRMEHTKLDISGKSVKLVNRGNDYVFPLDDCLVLPLEATSAENLSEYVLGELMKRIEVPQSVKRISVGIDESYGQGAWAIWQKE